MKSENTKRIEEDGKLKGYFIDKEDLQALYLMLEYVINNCNLPKSTQDYIRSFMNDWKE